MKKGNSMRRRDFFTAAAGVGAGTVLAGAASPAMAAERPAEKRLQIYQCNVCGSMVMICEPGKPTLVHCGRPMELLVEKNEDEGREKHVPVIEKIQGGFHVKVGSIPHPMTEAHHIAWIQLIAEDRVYCKILKPGDKPEATFQIDAVRVTARAYCNLHGLWKSK
jgi:superoxide reductase